MRLVVSIPERWEDDKSALRWAVVRPDGSLAGQGEGTIADLPRSRETRVVVAASRVLLAAARLPKRAAHRVALAYAVEDQLTSEPESVHVVTAGTLDGDLRSVAVIERDWLRRLLTSFESAGIAPASVTVETCLAPVVEDEWSLVLHAEGGFLRTGEASGMGLDHAFEGHLPAVLHLVLEAARSAGRTPRRMVVRADAPPDARAWERELGLRCAIAAPWHFWDFTERPAVEFLQGEFARNRGGWSAYWPRLRLAALFAAAALGVELVGTLSHWGALRYEKAQLEGRMSRQFREAFPHAQAIVEPALQMRRNLQAARAAAGVAQEGDFLSLLAGAARLRFPEDGKVKLVGYDKDRLTLDVALADEKQAGSILKRFEGSGFSATLNATKSEGAGETRFVIVSSSGR